MLCAICKKRPRGFGWTDPPTYSGSMKFYPAERNTSKKRFCSKHCQDIYYERYTRDLSMNEQAAETFAKNAVIEPLAEYVMKLGPGRNLFEYSREEIQGMIHLITSTYSEKLAEYYSEDIPF